MIARLLALAVLTASVGAHASGSAKPAEAVPPNLFPHQTWQPPPPPPPPPPKPTAPPLPFRYQGQLREGDAVIVFLALDKRQIIVKAGDVIDNTYQVDAVTPQWVNFTYLPLQQKQQLNTGSSQ